MTGFRIDSASLRATALGGLLACSIAQGVALGDVVCAPLEQRAPEARSQRQAVPGQTRACGVVAPVRFDVSVVARGFDEPWAVEPLPAGGFIVSEKSGRLRIVGADGRLESLAWRGDRASPAARRRRAPNQIALCDPNQGSAADVCGVLQPLRRFAGKLRALPDA